MFAPVPQDSVKPELSNDVICKALPPQPVVLLRRKGPVEESHILIRWTLDKKRHPLISWAETMMRPQWFPPTRRACKDHQNGDGWNKNGAARAAPTWSLREGPKALRARPKKCLPLKCDKSLSGRILAEFDDEYHITTSSPQANCSTTSTHEATGSTHIIFVRAKITLS